MVKPTCKKLREMVRDEIKASKEYRKYGFKTIARDEARHARILKNKLGRC